ncbi:MAG: DNA mismatch repair endonuclease MutL [Oscillospiraceae bacterium]|nr:DNA mismatch repair endonuclease MutL [Oscillospiraceae bacterium]
MAVINVLAPHVANMIAAGEVVERPGSVVKELMENAADAGARNITVELRGGGATFLRVTDDGCGMAPEDAGNCFLRHATSKLRDEHGPEAISTMGFRGEALAAIAAISHVELLTRREEDEAGTMVTLSGGEIQDMGPAGCPKGSVFTVKDLFYNTPARLKFMKSDRAEGAWCVQTALRVALGRPDISVRCIRDGREEFFTPGDGKPDSAVYALLGRDAALSMLPVQGENEGVSVTGFVGSPSAGRGNRAMQFFFVNGRGIRSQSLQAAVEQAYKNTLLVGRFPSCVLYISMSPGAVDVNVHPTKTEVKFSSEKRVFDAVYYSALNALQGREDRVELHLSRGTEKRLQPAVPASGQEPAHTAAPKAAPAEPAKGSAAPSAAPPEQMTIELHSPSYAYGRGMTAVVPPRRPLREESAPRQERQGQPTQPDPPRPAPRAPAAWEPKEPAADRRETVPPQEPVRVAGEVLRTYIIAEQGDRVLLIDKHAAHERLVFDALKARGREILSQGLIVPQTWRPAREDREALEENAALLRELGFDLEPYGEEDMILRAVPEALDPVQAIPALEEICEKLKTGSRDLARDGILQTISCKAAIKAGWDTDPMELQVLADKVASGQIKYCPHGRPVAMTLTKRELDKQFSRPALYNSKKSGGFIT